MKKASDALFRLAQAMTPSEKRYFHQYAQRHVVGEQNNYLQLFQLISRQRNYDEAALKRALPGETAAHFPVLKRQLFQLLLDCLSQYQRKAHPSEQVKRRIQAAGILKEKGLVKQARQELKAARKTINRYQLFIHLPELLQVEKSLLEQEVSRLPNTRKLGQWAAEWAEALESLEQEGRFGYYNLLMARRHYQKVSLSDKKEKSAVLELINSSRFTQGKEVKSLLARMDYFRTLATYHFMAREPEKALACNQALLGLLDQHPFLRELHPSRYIVALNNFLIDNFQLKNWKAVEEGLAKLRSLPGQTAFKKLKGLKPKIFEQSSLLELNMLISQKAYQQAQRQVSSIEEGLSLFSSQIALHNKLTLQYLLAYISFLNKNYSQSLGLLNELLAAQSKGLMEELFRFARLLQLLLHYELGNYELLSYLIPSARRLHQGMQPAYQTEALLLDTLRKLANAPDKKSKAEIVKSFQESLEPLSSVAQEARFFEYLDLWHWVQYFSL